MYLNIFVLLSLFLSHVAYSDSTKIVGLGVEGRLTKNVEDNHELKIPISLFAGYKNLPWVYSAEALYYKEQNQSAGSYEVKYQHYELTAYVSRFVFYEETRVINPYVVGGLGVLQEKIQTKIANVTTSDDSKIYGTAKLGAGIWASISERIFSSMEFKGMLSDAYSPKLMFSLAFRFGLEF